MLPRLITLGPMLHSTPGNRAAARSMPRSARRATLASGVLPAHDRHRRKYAFWLIYDVQGCRVRPTGAALGRNVKASDYAAEAQQFRIVARGR